MGKEQPAPKHPRYKDVPDGEYQCRLVKTKVDAANGNLWMEIAVTGRGKIMCNFPLDKSDRSFLDDSDNRDESEPHVLLKDSYTGLVHSPSHPEKKFVLSEPCPACGGRGSFPGDLVPYGSTTTRLPDEPCGLCSGTGVRLPPEVAKVLLECLDLPAVAHLKWPKTTGGLCGHAKYEAVTTNPDDVTCPYCEFEYSRCTTASRKSSRKG